MTELITTGVWTVRPGDEQNFVDAWTTFTQWAATMPGATRFRLGCDRSNPQRYVSFAPWEDMDAAHAWKQSPEFKQHMAQALQYVDHFEPTELSLVSDVSAIAAAGID